jgi:hypothetical protein
MCLLRVHQFVTESTSRHSIALTKKGTGFPMTHTATDQLIIRCPVCGSDSAMLHHDIRCSLLYRCLQCEHEWQIDPTDEFIMSQNTTDESGRRVPANPLSRLSNSARA